MSLRLDEMNIDEVEKYYKNIFKDELTNDEFSIIAQKYKNKYNEVNNYKNNGYKTSGGMGRGFKYTLNILYGWYIEELIYTVLNKNKLIKSVKYTGNDCEHNFIYDSENKSIKIAGEKTTTPDYLVELQNGQEFFIELKTASAGVFTIKKGNVTQLYKTMGETGIYSVIIMIDIINGLYEIKDINYFTGLHPFVNQRMEGQLCYEFPSPNKDLFELINENFLQNYNPKIFNNPDVVKYKLLNIAKNSNSDLYKIIKSKISYEKKLDEFNYQKMAFDEEINKMINKTPQIENLSWETIKKLLQN